MTTILASGRPDAETLKAFEHELNSIREKTMAKVGEKRCTLYPQHNTYSAQQ